MSNNGQLPAGWRSLRLGEICDRLDYGFTASANFTMEGPRFLRITDIQDGLVNWEKVPGCQISEKEAEDNRLVDGDIVFARTGATTGKSFLVRNPPRAVFASYLIRLRLKHGNDPEFLSLFFQSENYWRQIRCQARGMAQPNFNATMLAALDVLLPSLVEQQRIAKRLRAQLAEAARARAAVQAQGDTYDLFVHALLRESLAGACCRRLPLRECLREVTEGIGERWSEFPVLGATRGGLAPAKEPVGKNPGRYKPVHPGTVFYNPMRILLGSIAMVDDGDEPGITSPDYVAVTGVEGTLHPRWFYHWFRSTYGAQFIKSQTRGAVRERLMFRRLAPAEITVPDWETQVAVAAKLKEIKQAKRVIEGQLIELERLPAALLNQAFEGLNQ